MMKNIIITFMLGMVLPLCAMEKKEECYLALLPIDVQNRVLFFVKDDETDKEFIERIQKLQPIKANTYNRFLIYAKSTSPENDKSTHTVRNILRAFCPDRHKLAMLILSWNLEDTSMLTLVDLQKGQTMCGEELEGGDYKYIALSRGANTIAAIEHRLPADLGKPCYGPVKDILMIKNLVTQKKGEHDISDMYKVFSLAFNKQGTRVIVHGEIADGLDMRPSHKIFSVKDVIQKIDTVTPITVVKETPIVEAPLQQYFRERRICKSIEYK